jgi:E3 ubiquitin-protein ligase ZNF598
MRGRGGKQSGSTPDRQSTSNSPKAPQTISPDKGKAVEEADGEVCFICASPVIHTSIAPCNHPTCHICSLRMRALYKTKACAHCRTESDFVIFTDEDKRYEEFSEVDIAFVDTNLGIKYANKEIQEDTLLLLRYNCPDSDCDVACLGWPDLHRHVRSVHHKVMCDLCTRNKKVFTHEHELFTKEELHRHEQRGDDKPGAIDQSGFRGHPLCGFCKKHFYSDDELYTHCRERHERCHICDRRNPGQPAYYNNYASLEDHFRKDHFMCMDQECLEKKFVVFESEMDLQAHHIESHPNGLTKDARRVDLSDFSYRERYQPQRGGRGRDSQRGGGRGRGRDPNSDALPQSSAQPMRRDELAFQRQMALQNSQPTTHRGFAGHLTPSEPVENGTARPSAPAPNPFPSLSELNRALPDNSTPAPMTREQEVRQTRHKAVIERASRLLRNDQTKLAAFREKVSSYTRSSITATEIIESFFAMFDASSAELGKLVKELVEIFEIPSKRDGLLKAWNDWKAINEDYPSLPGSSATSTAKQSASGHGGTRVLRLKSSTAQSGRSPVSRTESWGSASSVASQLASTSRGKNPTSSSWRGATTGQPQASSSKRPAVVTDTSAFPALPAAPKPITSTFSRGPHVIRNGAPSSSGNVWKPGNGSASSNLEDLDGDGLNPVANEKKKSGRKKQTLMHWG